MSDTGVLSRQYQRTAQLASVIEEGVSRERGDEGSDFLAGGESWDAQRRELARTLGALARMINPQLGLPDPATAAEIPASMVRQLRALDREGHDVAARLAGISEALGADSKLSASEIELLGGLAARLETQASSLYRRLLPDR